MEETFQRFLKSHSAFGNNFTKLAAAVSVPRSQCDDGVGNSDSRLRDDEMVDNRVPSETLREDEEIEADNAIRKRLIASDNGGDPMKFEHNRLESFKTWPANAQVEANKLAKAGFYYLGIDYVVKCFSCKRTIDEWNFGDQAIAKHHALNPHCDFLLHKSDNVPHNRTNATLSSYNSTSALSGTTSFSSNLTNAATASTSRPQDLSIPFPTTSASTSSSTEKTWESFGSLLSEAERLKTFKGWPFEFVKPEDLARNGFFCLRDRDKVECFFCRGILGEWEVGDNPSVEHRKHFRRCPFVNGYKVGNVPIRQTSDDEGIENPTSSPDETWGGDVTGRYNYEMEVFSRPEKGHMTPLKLSKLGINEHAAPRHPNYATVEARLRTFQSWPIAIPQKPEKLAEAGFYYAGISDHVRCFCCDGGLRNWEANDDPWVEHARWFGKCCYLTLMKGHEFVEEARQQRPPILSEPGPSTSQPQMENCANAYMSTPVVRAALETGIDRNVVQLVTARKIELTGTPYDNPNALIEACMDYPYINESGNKNITPLTETSPNSFPMEVKQSNLSLAIPNASTLKVQPKSGDMSVEDENRLLKEMRLCKICMDEEIGVVFLPCGHLISCPKCAPSLKDCPMCRKEIRGTVRTFLS